MDEQDINESLNAETSDVTDADLDAAFQEFMGDNLESTETVETKEVQEETNETKLPHPESSRLGRKVRYMEDNMVSKREFDELNSKIDTLLVTVSRKPETPEYDEFGEEVKKQINIDELVDSRIAHNKQEEMRRNNAAMEKYRNDYISNLRELINEIEDPVIARQVFKKMTEEGGEFNRKFTDNAASDCSKNFIRAVKAVSTPFGGKRGASVPSGISATSTNKEPAKVVPQLDPDAEEFAKMMGMKEEDIIKALDGEMPMGLTGKRLG